MDDGRIRLRLATITPGQRIAGYDALLCGLRHPGSDLAGVDIRLPGKTTTEIVIPAKPARLSRVCQAAIFQDQDPVHALRNRVIVRDDDEACTELFIEFQH